MKLWPSLSVLGLRGVSYMPSEEGRTWEVMFRYNVYDV